MSVLYSEAPIKLQYSADSSVEMVTTQSFIIDQIIPGLDFRGEGTQKITSLLTLHSDESSKIILKPPFFLDWTLKIIQVDIGGNDSVFEFDSRQPQNSLISKELARWVDHPIHLTINKDLNIERNSEELKKFVNKFPSIQELDPYTFLEGLLVPIFGLADQELVQGATITKTNVRGDFGIALTTLKYTITEISERQVNARFEGIIEPRNLQLKSIFGEVTKDAMPTQLSVSGDVEGTISWDRSNAALCQISSSNTYRSKLQVLGIEWPLSVKIKSSLQTTPASVLVTAPK